MSIIDRIDRALASYRDRTALREELCRIRESVLAEEQKAQAQRTLLETVVNTLPIAVLLIDDLGKIVFTNSEAEALFFEGKKPEGQNFLQLLAAVPEGLRHALLSETDHIFSFGGQGDSERYHLVRRHFTLGSEPHSMLIVRNITSELSRQENAVLRKAIRVIHHEFANSLAPVRSLLQGARAKVGRPEWGAKLEQTLGVIEERVLHLSAFLTGFAALGRLPAARPEEVGWEAFLGRLGPLLADIDIAPAPPGRGWFDPAQLEQVIINLVKNAREAGSPPNEIRLLVLPAPDGGYRASVLDRGQGMSDEVLENALVPSFTTKATGSGMGLTIQLAPELLGLLSRAQWPGNVRQLENAIARCVALATGSVIGPQAFELIQNPSVGSSAAPDSNPPPKAGGPSFREQMEAFERNLLVSALAATQNNQSEAARRLGLNRATLYDRLKKYSLLPDSSKDA